MRKQLKVSLFLVMLLYIAWGVSLLFLPKLVHELISVDAYDSVTARMFGGALLAWGLGFLIAARSPGKEIVQAATVALLMVGVCAAASMFYFDVMPVTSMTFVSLVVNVGAAAMLIAYSSHARLKHYQDNSASL